MNLTDEDLDLLLDALLIMEERLKDDFYDELHGDEADADRLVTIERRQDHTTNLYERVGRALDDRRGLL